MTSQAHRAQPLISLAIAKTLDLPLFLFFALAFGMTWGIIPILHSIAQQSGVSDWYTLRQMGETLNFGRVSLAVSPWIVYLLTRVQDFAFTIAGLVVISVTRGKDGWRDIGRKLTQWRIGWRWYLITLLPFGLYGMAVLIAGGADSLTVTSETACRVFFSAEAGLFAMFFLHGPMGEEIGLRGFALPHLQESFSPFKASVIIGGLWAVWHLPVLWQRDVLSIAVFLIAAFLLSFIFTWLFNGSGQSLMSVLLFHTAQNSEEVVETLFPALTATDWEQVSTLALLIVGVAVAVQLWHTS